MTPASPVPRHCAYVGIGSNLDDPVVQVQAGIKALAELPDTRLNRRSSLFRSAPLGVTGQADFVNAVCQLATDLEPHKLLRRLLAIETQHGRVREHEKWGPRTLDLDLLLYDDLALVTPTLVLPHPRLHERAFVLYPLAEIDPVLMIPGRGRVSELLAACIGQQVQRLNS
ncbi:MAG: 2-amino-4-hydroxy-6-hydroxymethyldihydropteridine diphosphokinase [Acidiferrobacterales bacterium]|nr:2-amino-4-hydroxy-6-hydroxymethyldihydropteridine diphosphokinase [Acidiferrobacterales bacterium]